MSYGWNLLVLLFFSLFLWSSDRVSEVVIRSITTSSTQTNSRLTSKIKLPPTTLYTFTPHHCHGQTSQIEFFSLARSLLFFSVVFDCPKMYLDYLLLSCCRLRLFIHCQSDGIVIVLVSINSPSFLAWNAIKCFLKSLDVV